MVTRFALLPLLLTACPSDVYGPCDVVQDCDPLVADGCFTAPHTGQGFCTLVCTEDKDCPAGSQGELASCEPIGEGKKVCRLDK